MNVLHVTPYYAPAWSYGGVARSVTDLTRALAEVGHNVVVVTTDTLDHSRRIPVSQETIDGVLVIRVRNLSNTIRGNLSLSTPMRFGVTVRRLIVEHGIDLVHCHEVRTIENLSILCAASNLNRPLVVSPHGTLPYHVGRWRTKQLWDRIFGRRLLPCFDRVIVVTRAEAEDVHALWTSCGLPLHHNQVVVIPNGIFPDQFAHSPSRDLFRRQWGLGNGPVVIFLGRLTERKGPQLLIPAFAKASRNIPDARLLIVGPGDPRRSRLDVQIRKYDLTSRVFFTGLLDGGDKHAALAASDIFALPAVGEGFSIAALEAMACGLPLLLTPGCNFPEVAEAGAGLVVPREIGALSEALRTLLLDSDRRAAMGKRAYELVHAQYRWSQVVARLVTVYEAAMCEHQNGAHERSRGAHF